MDRNNYQDVSASYSSTTSNCSRKLFTIDSILGRLTNSSPKSIPSHIDKQYVIAESCERKKKHKISKRQIVSENAASIRKLFLMKVFQRFHNESFQFNGKRN